MGIRFYCPNGHKLNVKSFQAGMRGICPHCGIGVDIPLESTRPSSSELAKAKRRQQQAQAAEKKASPAVQKKKPPVPTAGQPVPTARPVPRPASSNPAPAPSAPAAPLEDFPVEAPTEQRVASVSAQRTATVPQATPVSPVSKTPELHGVPVPPRGRDSAVKGPLDEAPEAVWYVRPPTGGQYGPATRDTMRVWIAEGRVSPDSLVWREGWRDWQEAGVVFPQLAPATGDAVPELRTMIEQEVYAPGPTLGGPGSSPQRPNDPGNSGLIVVMMLALAAIVVVVIVLWFWLGSGDGRQGHTAGRGTAPAVERTLTARGAPVQLAPPDERLA